MSENKTTTDNAAPSSDEAWLGIVRTKVSRLRFGSVQITVHEGRVTQVESLEKTRFVTKAKDEGNS